MQKERHTGIYAGLIIFWLFVAFWQTWGHWRAINTERQKLLDRANVISNTIAVVVRSQEHFRMVFRPRLETALAELVKGSDLLAVAMLNKQGQVVASSGDISSLTTETLMSGKLIWRKDSVLLPNLVDMGSRFENEPSTQTSTIIYPTNPPRRDETTSSTLPRPPFPWENAASATQRGTILPPPPPPPEFTSGTALATTSMTAAQIMERPRPERFSHLRRPFWMSPLEFDEIQKKQGLHGFVLEIAILDYRATCRKDLLMRILITGLLGAAAFGLGLAWRAMQRNTRLQMRLLRANEINTHLKEMNLAAAGLAHETRNPLNIIRGLAQLIARMPQADAGIRAKTTAITEEVDRVTGRLSEFIQYSRPPEPHPTPVDILAILRDILPALEADMEDKRIRVELPAEIPHALADESLLRQVLFNLLLNAIQAAPQNGFIRVLARQETNQEVSVTIEDNGPGVAPDNEDRIFRPYFTTRQEGSGLGLAVVHQIVLAHQWEILYKPREHGGASFTISGIQKV